MRLPLGSSIHKKQRFASDAAFFKSEGAACSQNICKYLCVLMYSLCSSAFFCRTLLVRFAHQQRVLRYDTTQYINATNLQWLRLRVPASVRARHWCTRFKWVEHFTHSCDFASRCAKNMIITCGEHSKVVLAWNDRQDCCCIRHSPHIRICLRQTNWALRSPFHVIHSTRNSIWLKCQIAKFPRSENLFNYSSQLNWVWWHF